MWIEPLESRRLLSASAFAGAPAHAAELLATRAALHAKFAVTLTGNIVGTYTGYSPFAGGGSMTITAQTVKNFTGTMSIAGGPDVAFNAKLTTHKNNGSQGAGYYFTFPYKTGTTKLQCKGAFQYGANGFHVQFTGKLNGAKTPKPHGEFVFTPTDRSTFLR